MLVIITFLDAHSQRIPATPAAKQSAADDINWDMSRPILFMFVALRTSQWFRSKRHPIRKAESMILFLFSYGGKTCRYKTSG